MDERAYWVAFSHLDGLGPRRMEQLLRRFGQARAAWRASPAAWQEMGLPAKLGEERGAIDPERAWQAVESAGLSVLTWQDPDYPALLRQIPDPPFVLYLRGRLQPEDSRALAVVGTRRPTPYGQEATRTLVHELVLHSLTVVSGLARGIDTLAHRAALEAGGRTLAVLGSGLDRLYPPDNRRLAELIAERGALVSEFPPGVEARKGHFPRRNRIISGLATGTMVVEAGERSGALITARLAAEQGREVFAVPGSIFSAQSAGTHQLMLQGAKPVRSAADVVGQGPFEVVASASAAGVAPAGQLLQVLGAEPRHLNAIIQASGLPAAQVSSELVLLELRGLIRRVGANHYVRG